MAAMSRGVVVVVVVVRRRWVHAPMIHVLAMLTIRKSCIGSCFYAYMWLCFYNYGASLVGHSDHRSSAVIHDLHLRICLE